MFDQRDIVLIPFPYSDLSSSSKRPALIISNDKINKTQDRICCLITSKIRKGDLEIEEGSFESGNLPFKSSVRPHRIFTIHKNIIIKQICTVNKMFHNKVLDRLNDYLK